MEGNIEGSTCRVGPASVVCFLSTGPILSRMIIEAYATIAALSGSSCRVLSTTHILVFEVDP